MKSEIVSCSKNKKTEEVSEDDGFSVLPDDIIGSILSRLTMAEAARSSVLSVRWRYLWTYYSGSLDFDGSLVLHELNQLRCASKAELIHKERDRFRRWVDQVLKSLQTQTVEALRICFDLGNDSHVDAWVQFAIQKKVKKLELDLVHHYFTGTNGYEYCVVPSLLKLSNLPFLQVLRLSHVDVSGEHLEYLLSSCPFLETLAVYSSQSIMSFKVSNASSPLKLKKLEIEQCFNLKTLEISAENLVSFTYSGFDACTNYKHIPNLEEVCFRGAKVDISFINFCHLTTYDHSSQLKVLKLDIIVWNNVQLPENLVLANLHHLELFVAWMNEYYFDFCMSLMNRCPSLRTLTLKIAIMSEPIASEKFGMKHPYDHLEEVKLVGFSGSTTEVEFIEYIIGNAINLKKLLIDPISPFYLGVTFENKIRTIDDYSLARTCARDMGPNIPPWVEFVIL